MNLIPLENHRRQHECQYSRIAPQTRTQCTVCGFAEVRTDAVEAVGAVHSVIFLAECPRCDHRWTSREAIGVVQPLAAPARLFASRFERVPARVARGVVPAA